jgi:prefoldin subunit 5
MVKLEKTGMMSIEIKEHIKVLNFQKEYLQYQIAELQFKLDEINRKINDATSHN